MRTAAAKGLRGAVGRRRHVLRNALIPVVTMLGIQFGGLLGGAVIVEAIFDWPGLGRLLVTSISSRDYAVVQGTILLAASAFLFVNLLTDLTYGLLDPRIRTAGMTGQSSRRCFASLAGPDCHGTHQPAIERGHGGGRSGWDGRSATGRRRWLSSFSLSLASSRRFPRLFGVRRSARYDPPRRIPRSLTVVSLRIRRSGPRPVQPHDLWRSRLARHGVRRRCCRCLDRGANRAHCRLPRGPGRIRWSCAPSTSSWLFPRSCWRWD